MLTKGEPRSPFHAEPGQKAMAQKILRCLTILLFGVTAASADLQLNFNKLQLGEEVLGYYNGGFGSMLSGSGPTFGITFSPDFVTVGDGVFGPPSIGVELTSDSGTVDLTQDLSGFFFSFYYSSLVADGDVKVYAGPDGTGALLNTISLPNTFGSFGTAGDLEPVRFESIVFSGGPASVFDNITFSHSGLVIPEPSTVSLMLIVLLVFCVRKRAASIKVFGGRRVTVKSAVLIANDEPRVTKQPVDILVPGIHVSNEQRESQRSTSTNTGKIGLDV